MLTHLLNRSSSVILWPSLKPPIIGGEHHLVGVGVPPAGASLPRWRRDGGLPLPQRRAPGRNGFRAVVAQVMSRFNVGSWGSDSVPQSQPGRGSPGRVLARAGLRCSGLASRCRLHKLLHAWALNCSNACEDGAILIGRYRWISDAIVGAPKCLATDHTKYSASSGR
jgi:hypothetical protein